MSIGPCQSHDKGMQTPWELYSFYFLCLDYVIHHPVYKSDPLNGLDLSLLLKGLTLQKGTLSLGSTPVLLLPGSALGQTLTQTIISIILVVLDSLIEAKDPNTC